MKTTVKLIILATALYLAVPFTALADSTGSLSVSANVTGACDFGVSTMAFGDYTGAQLDVDGAISLNCVNGQVVQITLSGGDHVFNNTRIMSDGSTNSLSYNLYTSFTRNEVWGGTASLAGFTVSYTGTGSTDSLPVYGRIPGAQTPPEGTYTDTVVVTAEY